MLPDFLNKNLKNILVLRIITLLTRFIFLFFLTNTFSLDIVGLYGLIYALSAICSQLIPFEFNNYSTLKIFDSNVNHIKKIISNQLLFVLLSSIIFSFMYTFMFPYTNIIELYFWPVLFLIILETFSREFERLYIAVSKPLSKYVSIFLKTVPWMLIVIFYILKTPDTNFSIILNFWILSTFISVGYGIYLLNDYFIKFNNFGKYFSINFILRGLIFSAPFLISTIANTLNQYIGRFFLSSFLSNDLVGIFSIYFQFSVFLIIIADISYSIFLPKYSNNIKKQRNTENFKFEFFTIIILLISSLLIYFFSPFIFQYMNIELINNLSSFLIIVCAMFFLSVSGILRIRLFLNEKKNEIMISNLLSVMLSIICNLLLIKKMGLMGASISLLLPSISLCLLYIYFSKTNQILT